MKKWYDKVLLIIQILAVAFLLFFCYNSDSEQLSRPAIYAFLISSLCGVVRAVISQKRKKQESAVSNSKKTRFERLRGYGDHAGAAVLAGMLLKDWMGKACKKWRDIDQ